MTKGTTTFAELTQRGWRSGQGLDREILLRSHVRNILRMCY